MKNENKVENENKINTTNINGINVNMDMKIKYVSENPKRKNSKSRDRFEKYMKAKTVEEFYKLGGTRGDLRYDENKKFVEIIK